MSKSRCCSCLPFFNKEKPLYDYPDEIKLDVIEDDETDKTISPLWFKMTEELLPKLLKDENYQTTGIIKGNNALIIQIKLLVGLATANTDEKASFNDDLDIWNAQHLLAYLKSWHETHTELKHEGHIIKTNVFIPLLGIIDELRDKHLAPAYTMRRLYFKNGKETIEGGNAIQKFDDIFFHQPNLHHVRVPI